MPKDVTYIAFHPRAKMHAGFAIATMMTCGMAAPIWIIWAFVTKQAKSYDH